ncbi:MAG: ATP-binding protein, partial [Bacteroidales bacterium]
LIFVLTDRGAAFDPIQIPEADISLALEDRPIGGLGIFLVRKIMGEVTYQRINGENRLEMRKKLE